MVVMMFFGSLIKSVNAHARRFVRSTFLALSFSYERDM